MRLSPKALALCSIAALAACESPTRGPRPPSPKDDLARAIAAAHFAEDARPKCLEALAPLIEREDPDPRDLIYASGVHLVNSDTERARPLLARAQALLENDAALSYNLGVLAEIDVDFEGAARHFEKALALAPLDAPTLLHLADAVRDSDATRAVKLLEQVVAQGVDNAGAWYAAAIFPMWDRS